MNDKLTHALALAAKGFRVFPLVENGKLPAIQGWPTKATTDAKTIERWFGPDPITGWTTDHNIGVATGGDLAVLDVDNKNGVNGDATLDALSTIDDIPDSYQVQTPTGGRHIYFRVAEEVRNSASKLGAGLDIRGHHGFVVAAGSVIEGKAYTESAAPLATCPEWITRLCGAKSPPKDSGVVARIELDHPDAIARAAEYLKQAEPAIEGAGGDHHTFAVAAKVKDFGVSEPLCLELMLDHWNERCSPAWSPDQLQAKIRNAYAYGHSPPGIASPAMDFEPVTESNGRRLYLEYFEDIEVDTSTRPLIEDYLDQHSFSVIYGESNTGKTFVALDISFHIASGQAWNGANVEPGGVVYVAAEGGKGIRKRIAALRKRHPAIKPAIAVVPCGINLRGRNSDVDALVRLIDEAALGLGMPIGLVVIDTLSRAMSGANENASEDMTAFVAAIDKLRAACGAHVMVVHHSGKDTAKGARGHSSLRAATDTEFEVADNVLHVRKQRDMDYAEMRPFKLESVEVGMAATGKVITSCVVKWGEGGREFDEVPLTKDEQNCVMAVQAALADLGALAVDGVPREAVAAAYVSLGMPEPTPRTLQRIMLAAETKGALTRAGTNRWVKWNVV